MCRKNSGIEWIGEIPDDWNLIRFKDICVNRKEIAGARSSLFDRLALTLNGVIRRDKDDSDGLQPKEFDGYQIIYENDFIFKMIDLQNISTSRVGLSPYTGLVSPAYIRFSPRKKGQYNLFVYYFLMSLYYNCVYNNLGGNGVRSALNATDMGQFLIPFPSIDTQIHIVSMIENRCAAVDRLIENQQAQIEKLKEYKQSIITEAVTKGLDPSAPMKDSGVEWIGNICERFELRRLKEVAQILDEYRKPITADLRNQDAEILYDYYGASGVIDKIDGYTIDDHVMLIGEDGANLKMRNLPLMYEVNGKAWINNHAHILKPYLNMDFYYLFYCLESLDINPYITGSAQPKLSQENLKNIQLPVPPLEEQQKIADYLDKKCAEIDKLISIKQQKIETLTEYKKSLIYEYVTGKKQVG